MTRDELIEELKKAPVNGEVHVCATLPLHGVRIEIRREEVRGTRLRIQRITTIPKIEIEVSYD